MAIEAVEDRSNSQTIATKISKYMEVIADLTDQIKTKDTEIRTLKGGGQYTVNTGGVMEITHQHLMKKDLMEEVMLQLVLWQAQYLRKMVKNQAHF